MDDVENRMLRAENNRLSAQNNEFKGTNIHIAKFTPPPLSLAFHEIGNNNEVGRFFEKDGKLHFEGDVDKSAEIFVKEIIRMFNAQVKDK